MLRLWIEELYMKPTLNNNCPDVVIIHIRTSEANRKLKHLAKILQKIISKLIYYVNNMEYVKLLFLRFYPKQVLSCQS